MNWITYSFIAIICWGIWGFLMKQALNYLDWRQIFIIQSIFTLVTSLLILAFLRPSLNLLFPDIGYAILASIASSLAVIAFYHALDAGEAIIIVPLTAALYPVVTVILSYLILNEKIGLLRGIGIVLALIGVLLISIEQ